MKTERNIITIDEYGQIHFPSTTNNDIWMSTNELINLFGITSPTLRANTQPYTKAMSLTNTMCKRVSNYPME